MDRIAAPGRGAPWRWSTSDVEPRRALSYWIDTICDAILELDIDSPDRDNFRARLDQRKFGPGTLGVVEAPTQSIYRTRARISRSLHNSFYLLHMRTGSMRYRRQGRDTYVRTGDCVLLDCKERFLLDCPQATRCVVLRFPEDWLRTWRPTPERFVAKTFSPSAGWSAALGSALANLDTTMEEELALPDSVIAEQIGALLALAAGPRGHVTSGRDQIRARLVQTLRDRCHEPDLTPAAVASDNGISKRYLHYLFLQLNTTFGQELIRLRLECAHRLLNDKRYDEVSVIEVAARCGFIAPSHFARRFRQIYGVGPDQFRRNRNPRIDRQAPEIVPTLPCE